MKISCPFAAGKRYRVLRAFGLPSQTASIGEVVRFESIMEVVSDDEPPDEWPRISGVHGVFKHIDESIVGGRLRKTSAKMFDNRKLGALRQRQIDAVKYLDTVVEELLDVVPRNTYITVTADHGELFGEDGYFGHGPIQHEKVFEVPFVEGKVR